MKRFRFLFSPVLMAILLIVLGIAMAVATFVENDFGADTARSMVYNTHWFELLFLLLVINLAGQIVIFRLYRKEKLTVMLFHLAFIVIIIGAAITRYTGYDGMMHIREGETTSATYSSDNEIIFDLYDSNGRVVAGHTKAVNFETGKKNLYSKVLSAGGERVRLTVDRFFPEAARELKEATEGLPAVSFIATRDMVTTDHIVLCLGEQTSVGQMSIGFNTDADIRVTTVNGAFFIKSGKEMSITRMTDMVKAVYGPDTLIALNQGAVYTIGDYRFMPQLLTMNGVVVPVDVTPETGTQSGSALECTLAGSGFEKKVYMWEDPQFSRSVWEGIAGDFKARISYGSTVLTLPFSLTLDDFMVERYPGSNSPSGFKSRVTLADSTRKVGFGYDIYMNHILKYSGYRFYQSSYDKDEQGTVLSVNHDPAGMVTTYAGYSLLFMFIVFSLINRKSFFRTVKPGYWNSRYMKPVSAMIILLIISSLTPARSQQLVIQRDEADRFGSILAQDQKGRTKPLYTVSSDILRKVAKANQLDGLSPMQVFLGYSLDFYHWQNVPLIKVSNEELRNLLGIKGDMAAFSDVVTFGESGGYKLVSYVDKAYTKPDGGRSRFDKEVIKVDERVNICYMMSKGDFLRIFPLRDSTDHWGTAEEAVRNISNEDSLFVLWALPLWVQSVTAVGKHGAPTADYVKAIKHYQRKYSYYDLPSEKKVKAELFYYRAKIFEKLFPFYASLGLIMIITLISLIIRGKRRAGIFLRLLAGLVVAGFVLHTIGLGIRWYISGHSPMSNGYESMIFISWVIMLAGLFFSRKSLLTFAAAAVLAGMTLMVAHLSFMDPEITNLVPVLKSYWLTLHVSVIISSYGFLGLGAILGLIVLVMMLFVNADNRARMNQVTDELTLINFRTLTLGLYFLTIGTFLGAVWANESWGRYWGWDPKETWSLITIIVYTLVTHSRMIPGMKDVFVFNLISLFAFSSVLMTYFGVNYYLSGLHSYAGGEAAPVPVFVYVAVAIMVTLAIAAGYRYRHMAIKQ